LGAKKNWRFRIRGKKFFIQETVGKEAANVRIFCYS
jgi:hypothetical protein